MPVILIPLHFAIRSIYHYHCGAGLGMPLTGRARSGEVGRGRVCCQSPIISTLFSCSSLLQVFSVSTFPIFQSVYFVGLRLFRPQKLRVVPSGEGDCERCCHLPTLAQLRVGGFLWHSKRTRIGFASWKGRRNWRENISAEFKRSILHFGISS